jgi:hypothetical protein
VRLGEAFSDALAIGRERRIVGMEVHVMIHDLREALAREPFKQAVVGARAQK